MKKQRKKTPYTNKQIHTHFHTHIWMEKSVSIVMFLFGSNARVLSSFAYGIHTHIKIILFQYVWRANFSRILCVCTVIVDFIWWETLSMTQQYAMCKNRGIFPVDTRQQNTFWFISNGMFFLLLLLLLLLMLLLFVG